MLMNHYLGTSLSYINWTLGSLFTVTFPTSQLTRLEWMITL
ncbi:MAG: hypothetical protein J07HQW2_01785 [Haloquadratum walsbyi J07HQW2]|uniref:Uncharacterized protein n=1 Tax=Haloquadratum walsbyi J07HQW2 TaxID=1238425 RepID=U1PSI1_9EURY|nr:MAG: hypothetical protein J07HQW2_01785 [Haloquadratum walsbyi J07HQW2]